MLESPENNWCDYGSMDSSVTGHLCGEFTGHRWNPPPPPPPHKDQWLGALMFSLICAWINAWVNNGDAGDLRRHRAHCHVIVMKKSYGSFLTVTIRSDYNLAYQDTSAAIPCVHLWTDGTAKRKIKWSKMLTRFQLWAYKIVSST